jgi:hypothetical protein
VTTQTRRRVRLRLARQRPGPGRVRAREVVTDPQPDPQPESDVSRLRRVWRGVQRVRWAHIITVVGTAIAAVAAIGGLWAQAVTTYWSQQTAKDQLEQSKEETEDAKSSQANRITFWLAPNKGDWYRPHIANRSPDGVTAVYLVRTYPNSRVAIYLGSLMPCTETVFMPKKGGFFKTTNDATVWSRAGLPASLYFVDRAGVSWRRDPTGLNQLPTPGPPEPSEHLFAPDEWLETKTAKLCGDA